MSRLKEALGTLGAGLGAFVASGFSRAALQRRLEQEQLDVRLQAVAGPEDLPVAEAFIGRLMGLPQGRSTSRIDRLEATEWAYGLAIRGYLRDVERTVFADVTSARLTLSWVCNGGHRWNEL